MSNAFTNMLRASAKSLAAQASTSNDWFADSVESLGKRDPNRIFQKQSAPVIGGMFLFLYDPKYKDVLPFYDMYPLVLPVEMYSDGLLGINLHYLQPMARVSLLKALVDVNDGNKYTKTKKLTLSYEILKAYSNQLKGVDGCIKRYLYGHVRSSFHQVDMIDWQKAALLQTHRWKVNPNKRYAGSPPY